MSFGRTKLLVSFAFLGFFIGTAAFYAFDWLLNNTAMGTYQTPILEMVTRPWFLSGIGGSILSVVVLFVSAKFLTEKT